MGYRTKQTGYPNELLASRAVIQRGNFALIPPKGLVKNIIPGFEDCEISILASPKLGAAFADYSCTVLPGGKNEMGFGEEGIESFLYVIEGTLQTRVGEDSFCLEAGGYVYAPPTKKIYFRNETNENVEIFLYKKRYQPLGELEPYTVVGNVNQLEAEDYEGMTDVHLTNLLPAGLEFDMNFHILAFDPGASHGYIETHVQEHGAIILTGEGLYNLDNHWIPVETGDYIFMGAYSLQAGYSVGRERPFSYLYSKDCNRDVTL